MSFGYSVGDPILLIQLARKTADEAQSACGQHDELTREVTAFYTVLNLLETQYADPGSAFNTADENRKQELIELMNGSKKILDVLHSVLARYNTLSEGKGKSKKLWSKVRFGNGEMHDMADIRLKLSTYTSAILMSLNLISLDSQGRIESYLNSHEAELENLRKSINWITAGMRVQESDGSVLTTYDEDDKQMWKDFRRGLIGQGWSESALKQHKEVILEYVKELGQRGVLDELDERQDDAQEKPDLGETNHDGKALERAISEDRPSSYENETVWVGEDSQKTTLAEDRLVLRERIFERDAEIDPSNYKKRSTVGEESPEVFFMDMEASRSPHPSPPSAPTQTLSDKAILTRKDDKLNQSIQERYDQKVEQYLATYDDSDLESIASYAPSILSEDSSTSSFSSDPSRASAGKIPSAILEGVEHILAEPFLSNTTFGPAYVVAIENIGVARFSRNLTRLLDRYSSDLRKEAQGWLEINTARVLRTRVPRIVSIIADASSGMMLANRTDKDTTALRIEILLRQQRLRGLISAIADVVDGNVNGEEEIEAPDEDVMPRLKEAKHFMASSQAFRRFQEDLRMFVFPIMGLYIRTIIRSNSRSIPDRGPIHIRCQARWEILDFCEKELQGYSDLMSLLTLTGTPTSAQADSCEDYVRETWGPAGLELLNRFILGLKTKSCDAFLAEGRYVHIDFHPKNQEHPEMASIHLTGNLDQIIEILEQLSWFAVTFRTSSKGQLTMSHAIFQERPGKLKFEKGEPEFELSLVTPRHHSISVNPNDNLEQSNCWLPLFSSGILAQGFPIRQRPEAALGLDLAFPVLAQLARLDGPMSYAEGIVFSGKLSIIFPTRLLDAGTRGVQWHFVGVDDPASIVDILEESEWFQSRDFEQLITSRAFLGYCRYSQVLAGTKESLERSQIGESCIQRSISRLEIRPEANISTTLTANGVWAATLKTKVVLSKGLRAQIGDDEIDFRDRVHRTVKSPVLVFDTATQSAWLIPEVSLILHMVHEYLKQDWVQTPRGPEVTLPYAQMSPDGGRAAFNAIVEHGHQELWERQEDGQAKRFMDVVNDYLKIFDIIRKEINMKKAAARRTLRHPRLLGWDFMDILSKEHLFFERELPEDMGPRMAWWELAINTDTLVIFGSNFGQLIRPHPEQTPVCKAWNPIPENFNLLIASARCIMYLAMKCNARDSSCRKVADGLEWHTPKGSYLYGHPCVKAGCETCMFIQELRAPQKKPWQRHEKNLAGGESIEPDGALIFGSVDHYHKLLKRRRQTLVNRTMPPSPAGPSNTPFGANTQSSPVASNIPVSGAATIRAFSISNLGAQQPRANSASTEIAFQNSPLSSSLGKSTVNQPALHLRDEQSRPSDQIQAA